MQNKTIRAVSTALLAAVWLGLSAFAWLRPADALSLSERRPLEQFPQLSKDSLLSGSFMSDFESYTMDQFPLRDHFRQLKALFHYNVLRQGDNNGIYLRDGYAAQLEYPLDDSSLSQALKVFNSVYHKYLAGTGSQITAAVIPDKGYYLADAAGVPSMDYDALFSKMEEGMPWANYVNLTDTLELGSYYRTDTHWRQEALLDAAQRLSQALDIPAPQPEDYTAVEASVPFRGVYYGQAALPMAPDILRYLESDLLRDCTVYNYESQSYESVYPQEKLTGLDPYEVFLSGPVSLLTVENPHAETDRELIIFRDSFGSSIAPLLVQGYSKVTLVDIRYLSSSMLDRFIDFHGQDVLFLYSTLVLNNSNTIK